VRVFHFPLIIPVNTTYRRKSDIDIECPIQEGAYNVTQTVALPKEIPPGTTHRSIRLAVLIFFCHTVKFVVEVKGYTVDDKDLVCVNLMVDFMKHMASKKLGW
jgi:hypothetical protein